MLCAVAGRRCQRLAAAGAVSHGSCSASQDHPAHIP